MGQALFDYNMRLIQLSVIQLSGGHCTFFYWQNFAQWIAHECTFLVPGV